ncbi:NGFI-A-binding protein homolog isoform X2 [Contarinia nasturtii]|uniref:NGFI-A-binding protein homolog isoform X2 n=1 Tax=Contarinia nasturtii TaxID=265458 RepID=UPI0012D451F2|nr:NGFI-A-binding protein homolog isoform X2 [Contarinia nasturtii]
MEISGGPPSSTSHQTQATSSSVIVQSSQPEEGVSLTSLSDIHQLHHHHHHQQQQQQQQQGALVVSALGSGSISVAAPHPKFHPLHHSHLHATQQTPAHFGAIRTPSSLQQQQASSSSASSPILSPPGKTLGRNNNGTMVSTSTPQNEAELQLYRVLQRASLLAYYDTLLEMGGDDVQQLCDAGEDEFLEIMALVGMASKPLHVRRFQKSLAEWVSNPAAFKVPLSSIESTRTEPFSPEPVTQSRSPFHPIPTYSPSSISGAATMGSTFSTIGSISSHMGSSMGAASATPTSSIQLTPSLSDEQVIRLTRAAERVASQYTLLDTKPQSTKKRSTKEIDAIIALSENDPRRMEGIRKFSAIYGRFDCKRRPEKPLTLHEVCVNEAAAQMCRFIPALLTRRQELFPLARQVVKDAGFGHSAGIARIAMSQQSTSSRSAEEDTQTKRMRLPSDTSSEYSKEYPCRDSAEEMRHNLLQIYHKLGKSFDVGDIAARFSSTRYSRSDCEDDSRFSFSSSSSPQLQSSNGGDNDVEEENKMLSEMVDEKEVTVTANINANGNGSLGVRVLSASGNNIIAVTNPALALSPTLVEPINIKREATDD